MQASLLCPLCGSKALARSNFVTLAKYLNLSWQLAGGLDLARSESHEKILSAAIYQQQRRAARCLCQRGCDVALRSNRLMIDLKDRIASLEACAGRCSGRVNVRDDNSGRAR